MTCREFIGFLMQYVDGELPEDTRGAFDKHLEVCPSCVSYLDSYRTTVRLAEELRECGDDPVPPSVPDDLVQAILKARKGEPPQS